jgi:hypothetical protein
MEIPDKVFDISLEYPPPNQNAAQIYGPAAESPRRPFCFDAGSRDYSRLARALNPGYTLAWIKE